MKRIHVIGCILPLSNPSLPREQCVKRATVQKKISDITFMSSTLYGFLKVSAEHLSHKQRLGAERLKKNTFYHVV